MTASQPFRIRYYRHGKIVLIRVEGPLISTTSSGLVRPALSLFKKGVYGVVIDLSVAKRLDAGGVETLLEIAAVSENLGRPQLAVVASLRTQPEKFLRERGPYESLRIFASTDEAFEAEHVEPPPPDDGSPIPVEEGELYLTIRRSKQSGVMVFEIDGELDVEEVGRVKARVLQDVSAGNHLVVLDLKDVDFIDSSALGLFVSLKNKLAVFSGDLRFSRLSPNVRRVFEVFRLPRLYQVFDTVEAAVKSFQNKDSTA